MKFFESRKIEKLKLSERENLKSQIDDCLNYIKSLRRGFDEASDKELVSYFIYEKRAAEMRYLYLLGLYSDLIKSDGA